MTAEETFTESRAEKTTKMSDAAESTKTWNEMIDESDRAAEDAQDELKLSTHKDASAAALIAIAAELRAARIAARPRSGRR